MPNSPIVRRAALFAAALAAALALPVVVPAPWIAEARAQEAPKKTWPPVMIRIEGTNIEASVALAGFGPNPNALAKLKEKVGSRALLAGSGGDGVIFAVAAEKIEGAPLTNVEYRDKMGNVGKDTDTFEMEGWAVADDSKLNNDLTQVDYRAFGAVAGYVFELRVSQLANSDDEAFFSRRRLRRLVESFRVGTFRPGTAEDYPAEVVDGLHALAMKHPGWRAAADAAIAEKPADWTAAYCAWAASKMFSAPAADTAAAAEKAAAALAASNPTDPKACFAWSAVETALGSAAHADGKFKVAVVHFKKACDVAPTGQSVLRAAASYGLARSHAKIGAPKDAIPALKAAIEGDPQWRDAAAKEPDFASIKGKPEFKALLAPPASPAK